MGKKKIKTRKSQYRAKSIAIIAPGDLVALYKKADRIELVSLLLGFPLLFVITQIPFARDAIEQSSNWLFAPYVSAWFVLGYLNWQNVAEQRELRFRSKTETPAYMNVLKKKIILTSLATVLCVLGFFYLAGGHYLLVDLVKRILPQLHQRLASFLARAVEWVVSGIVGGIAYKYFEGARQRILGRSNQRKSVREHT